MYVVSPWSRGGWVNSQVFDHSSVIRFLETRFGFHEPNISPWRRAVCGDLTSAFDFSGGGPTPATLPDPRGQAIRAAAIKGQVSPQAPSATDRPWQEPGIRRSRPLPYRLEVKERPDAQGPRLSFHSDGASAVFHVYDRTALDQPPRRYTLAAGTEMEDVWPLDQAGRYDLWVLGPGGFHRHLVGKGMAKTALSWSVGDDGLTLAIPKAWDDVRVVRQRPGAKPGPAEPLHPGQHRWALNDSLGWYDVTLTRATDPDYRRRLTGRHDGSLDAPIHGLSPSPTWRPAPEKVWPGVGGGGPVQGSAAAALAILTPAKTAHQISTRRIMPPSSGLCGRAGRARIAPTSPSRLAFRACNSSDPSSWN